MNDDRHLIFYIDAYSPETIPMAKLAEYMADFAALLGKDNAVHFSGLNKGSTQLVARVEFEDVPKVTTRLNDIRRGTPPKDALKIFDQIDKRLANDNATGRIFVEGEDSVAPVELLAFPGRDRPKAQSYGPFTQEGNLDGILIAVGGKDETVPLRLQNGKSTYSNCDTTRTVARELAKHLFEPVRIYGTGRWMRETDNSWNSSPLSCSPVRGAGKNQPARHSHRPARCPGRRMENRGRSPCRTGGLAARRRRRVALNGRL